ncbi:uncharacterized protein Z519_12112 [Cladophialophora bantiana CBS 173.52]|uniref:Uncharacterized protein n=1 Tax=Cladophialophora bantiana (strain ATCC 10958 / CBS 173.52 / CDC B-1940 / NIH 8579) TaxID=1442370 RepID=A0A0D2H8I2_CLAB1|nr:uncharacterized protein Z519_12112 [Cladophialophora bantiana CBS 173.52]KIW87210.1 hypothetical protein Z519_12112 [Cladophialophora bantiana CBS 173.52]
MLQSLLTLALPVLSTTAATVFLPPTIFCEMEWRNRMETTHDKMYIQVPSRKRLEETPAAKAPARQRKPVCSKRKRQDEIADPLMPGVYLLDMSEEMPQKKARRDGDEASMLSDTLESPDFSNAPLTNFDTCSDIQASSGSSDCGESSEIFSAGPLSDTVTTPNSPAFLDFDSDSTLVDPALLAGAEEDRPRGSETSDDVDETGWDFMTGVETSAYTPMNELDFMGNGE